MYKLKMKQMKLRVSIITGRLRFIHRISHWDPRAATSVGSCKVVFSGSTDFCANRKRITGVYVSLKNGMPIRAATPHNALMTMKTYLTPMLCVINPPAMGPITGPSDGIRSTHGVGQDLLAHRLEDRENKEPWLLLSLVPRTRR